ncbi:MAG TPA: FAD-linked oxidase C-terminal domain-containing protein [Candidatus Paceibacterota bacterium]|nr:FAD-linked oxidase C-terminal domain-containing protein [Verrucomicrobiota bacterium]HSA09600.1 FAD-linked oxidase C-terminal domain-containing protein [Candidatus Paceibacterota bacterium]
MISAQQQSTLRGANCEIAFDNLTRQLYATDASIYQITPAAVAFPVNTRQVSLLIDAAVMAGVAVTPRGAGTGLAGGALGDGLVIDFSRYCRQISDLDLEQRTVRVEPGVILDQLNNFLRPHGYWFGPDVATSARATLGGMIANNSSGSHAPVYGTTADHINELEVVLADGRNVAVGPKHDTLRKQRELVGDLLYFHGLTIAERLPPGLSKRWPGYAIDRCVREPGNLNHLLCGSEGTLAAITSAEVRIVPLPKQRGLGLIFFASLAEAMQATVELLDLKPAAIEHLDRLLFDQTKGQRQFQAARDLLELEHKPCQSILMVEFFDDVEDRLAALATRHLGLRKLIVKGQAEANLIRSLRQAGLSLLTGRKGAAKPTTGIEDAAVRPRDLPAYVAGLQSLLAPLGLQASFYGHAASGLLHVRPILDLHSAEDLKKFRHLANEVSTLVREFNGSLAAEHGVGLARTEYMPEQLGDGLLDAMREIKTSFDPNNLYNPGKILPDGRYKIDTLLRQGAGHELKLPFAPVLAFAAKDGSFTRNLEQCNGCGGCRKETPSMCPTFIATGEEIMSTRGRANAIRAALELRGLDGADPLRCAELDAALSNCLSCKACTTECPSNVNLTLLKAELLHARIQRTGLSWRERVISNVDFLGRLGCRMPRLANFVLDSLFVRGILTKTLGLAWQRPPPHYARQRFDHWFARRGRSAPAPRGRVVLWDDTFVRYHEPHIGIAAVKVLEAAGFEVVLPVGRKCCGRPAFSQGNLDEAKRLGRHNLALLHRDVDAAPIIFLEASCYSMFVEDYRELSLEGTEPVARRCHLFEQFIEALLSHEPEALRFKTKAGNMIIHAHCHAKALTDTANLRRLAERLPERNVTLLDTGCCGMAGAFGALASKYELSLKVAEPLARKVRSQPFGTVVVASGTSCRHQIDHLAPVRARHMAEVLADALA